MGLQLAGDGAAIQPQHNIHNHWRDSMSMAAGAIDSTAVQVPVMGLQLVGDGAAEIVKGQLLTPCCRPTDLCDLCVQVLLTLLKSGFC